MAVLRHLISWGLAIFLIAMFVQATIHPFSDPPIGEVKFYDLPGENIVFQTLAERSGFVLFEPAGRVFVALLELLCAFLLLIPYTRRIGAAVSFLILAGAISLHMSDWLGREIPTSLTDPAAPSDGGALFSLAIAMAVASVLVIVVHPSARRRW